MKEKRNSLFLILISSISFILLTGCINQLSTTKWGILTQVEQAVLLKVPPNGKVTVCADQQQVGQYVARAVLVWAKEIGRADYMTSTSDCSNNADVKLTVKAGNVPTANTSYWNGTINYNVSDSKFANFAPMLHEVGHNWGLCDQYTNGLWNCSQSVQNAWSENSNGRSVMGGNWAETLADDDIKGIKYISEMPNVGQNEQWKSFLQNKNNSTTSSSTEENSTDTKQSEPTEYIPSTGNKVIDDSLSTIRHL